MASIFQNAVKYVGDTLKQVVTPDNLRDYRHANQLFVGSNFRLVPKSGFLFHVFFDINTGISSPVVAGSVPKQELGLMVKSVDLPKFRFDTKIYNSYNRPNIVQSKIKMEPVQIVFHDDSANVVRNFWYDYYRYYYRDSDYTLENYKLNYKYNNDQEAFPFGFGPGATRATITSDGEITNYLSSIRIYSLHQKRFSEYVLINPVITTFRHSNHAYENTQGLMQHDMTVEYENILYNTGSVTMSRGSSNQTNGVVGFGDLHYDKTPSPLRLAGGAKSIFGTNGLLDTAGEVLDDFSQGNYGAAIFKAARGINTARGMNLKKAAISEITSIYTQEASRAITGQIAQTLNPGAARGAVTVSTVAAIDGATSTKYTGINQSTSVAALAGAAILLNSTPVTNRYRTNPTNQSNYTTPPTNYNPRLPAVPGYVAGSQQTNNLTLNDGAANTVTTNQQLRNPSAERRELGQALVTIDSSIQRVSEELGQAERQSTVTAQTIAQLTAKYATIQTSLDPNKTVLLAQTQTAIDEYTALKLQADNTVTQRRSDIAALNSEKNQVAIKLEQLRGV